jgi:hypothetical protein
MECSGPPPLATLSTSRHDAGRSARRPPQRTLISYRQDPARAFHNLRLPRALFFTVAPQGAPIFARLCANPCSTEFIQSEMAVTRLLLLRGVELYAVAVRWRIRGCNEITFVFSPRFIRSPIEKLGSSILAMLVAASLVATLANPFVLHRT